MDLGKKHYIPCAEFLNSPTEMNDEKLHGTPQTTCPAAFIGSHSRPCNNACTYVAIDASQQSVHIYFHGLTKACVCLSNIMELNFAM